MIIAAAACRPAIQGGPTPAHPPPGTDPILMGAIQLRPGSVRYAVHRKVRIEEEIAGRAPTHMSYSLFLTAAISGPADSTGYAVVHTVDSVVADSGSFVPPTVNFAAARGLRFSGRLLPTGIVRNTAASDSAAAQSFGQFLGNLRDFYPRLPPAGLSPQATWTDTTTTSDRVAGGEVQVQSSHTSAATGWEARGGAQCLRIETQGTFTVHGVMSQGGQPMEMSGTGTRRGMACVSADGRYLGGEQRDSTSLNVSLPVQGVTVPIRQVVQTTVTVLP
jgi:hypothetical protein